jgi:hypothetical protein
MNRILESKAPMKQFLLFVLIIFSFDAIAQNEYKLTMGTDKLYKEISFGEKIFFGNVDDTAKWTVINTKENRIISLSGNQINNYIFEKPGSYEISFSENKKHSDDCNHPQFPEKMLVKVNSVRMQFDFSKIDFSEKIQKGRDCENIIITVPVNITTKDNSSTSLSSPGLIIAGIGTTLTAKPLSQEVMIKDGVQFLKYQLSGTVNKDTYLMFDFFDFNNQVQTYNLLEIIN